MIIPSDDHFPFKCENCGGEFTDRLLLYDHIENCYPITCRYCPKIVCDYERLKVHVSWCHNSFISQCRYCLYISYGDAADIEAHRRKICPALGGLTCEHCPEEFPSFQTLGSHTCNRIVNFWNKCGYCAFRTYSIERLKSHHDAHFNEAAFFWCPACAWGSDSYNRVRSHILHYHDGKAAILTALSSVRCLLCSFCGKLVVVVVSTYLKVVQSCWLYSFTNCFSLFFLCLCLWTNSKTGRKPESRFWRSISDI